MGNSPGTYEEWRKRATLERGEPILSVAIGGNVQGVPMNEVSWTRYQAMVRRLLKRTVGPVSFAITGHSEWKGIQERSVQFSVLQPNMDAVSDLRQELAELTANHGQDAIAVTIGHSELITPKVSAEVRDAA